MFRKTIAIWIMVNFIVIAFVNLTKGQHNEIGEHSVEKRRIRFIDCTKCKRNCYNCTGECPLCVADCQCLGSCGRCKTDCDCDGTCEKCINRCECEGNCGKCRMRCECPGSCSWCRNRCNCGHESRRHCSWFTQNVLLNSVIYCNMY